MDESESCEKQSSAKHAQMLRLSSSYVRDREKSSEGWGFENISLIDAREKGFRKYHI